MLMTGDAFLFLYAFLVVYFAFIIKGLVGFGDPLISNPLLAMRLDNKVITPAMLPVSVVLNAVIAFKNRKNFSIKKVAPIAVFVLAGIVPGTLLLKLGAPWILKVVLGILIIGLGLEMLTRDRGKEFRANIVIQSLISFCSGITAGLFGINLLFLIYLERTAKERGEFRGSVCFVFFLENFVRTFVYLFAGIFSKETVILTAITIPAALLGMLTGGVLDRHIDDAKIRKMIIYVFILGGLSTLIKALIFRS